MCFVQRENDLQLVLFALKTSLSLRQRQKFNSRIEVTSWCASLGTK